MHFVRPTEQWADAMRVRIGSAEGAENACRTRRQTRCMGQRLGVQQSNVCALQSAAKALAPPLHWLREGLEQQRGEACLLC